MIAISRLVAPMITGTALFGVISWLSAPPASPPTAASSATVHLEAASRRQASVTDAGSPAGPGARFPSLARAADGRVAMVWMERGADSVPLVKLAVRQRGGAWSAPSIVVRDSALFVNFADVPRATWSATDQLVVTWLQRGGPGKYDYGVRAARSRDEGRNWVRMAPPHDPDERGEHGFVALQADGRGGVGMTFLNGKDQAKSGTAVAYAELDRNGTLTLSRMLDVRSCDCCQTAMAMTSSGPVVAFRDRTQEEIRDIAVTRRVDGTWTTPATVGNDRWKISGCPVNGPAIAASNRRVALAWFSAARDSAKVQLAFSNDAGARFGEAIRIDNGAPAGHVDVTLLPDGGAVVSWLERLDGDDLAVRLRRVSPSGTLHAPMTLSTVKGIRPAGWPAMVVDGDGLLVAYTVPGAPSRIAVQHVRGGALR